MSKNYNKKFKFETSTTTPNKYIILRRKFFNYQEVAYAKIIKGESHQLEALVQLEPDEVQYLTKKLREIAGIKNVQTFVS